VVVWVAVCVAVWLGVFKAVPDRVCVGGWVPVPVSVDERVAVVVCVFDAV
jgi:hypothetical protein